MLIECPLQLDFISAQWWQTSLSYDVLKDFKRIRAINLAYCQQVLAAFAALDFPSEYPLGFL